MFLSIFTDEQIQNFDFVDGLLPSLVAIIVVFLILFLLILAIELMHKAVRKPQEEAKEIVYQEQKKFTIDDIKDDDMMAAALVATIDYANETKQDVRLVSIKEIK